MNRFIFYLFFFFISFGMLIVSCTPRNQLSMRDTAFSFSKALLQGNEKIINQLLLPNDVNERLYKQWSKWYSLLDEDKKYQLFLRSQSKFEIVNTDVLQMDSLVIVQIKFDIPNIPNNILKMVYFKKQWLVDWRYSESGNF